MPRIQDILPPAIRYLPIVCTLLTIWGWGASTQAQPAPRKLKIVVTTSMLGDAVHHIVQDRAEVITLMKPGIDPHMYKATPRDIQALVKADIIFYNGLHLEGKMADILHKYGLRKPVYAASDGIETAHYIVDPNFAQGIDPHIWFDASLWRQVVQYISSHLQVADPINKSHYQENTQLYVAQLDHLHQAIQAAIQQIPASQRVLISAHDAFSYWGRAYGVEVRGLQGISTLEECGLRDITDLVRFIVERKIKAIFPETSVPDKPLRAVVAGCKQRGHPVILATALYSDALGEAGTPAGTYIGMMYANVITIVNALK